MLAATSVVVPDHNFTHGYSGYTNYRCRCPECREANRVHVAKRRTERRLLLAKDPTLAPHGMDSTYLNWGCRCSDCRSAHSDVRRAQKVAA
jgi:hypothetical protein